MRRVKTKNQQELFPSKIYDKDKFYYERLAVHNGAAVVAGVDEAGRGPLSGPVVAAAVILPQETKIRGIRDSKKLLPIKREVLFKQILENAISVGVGFVEPEIIDKINILQAAMLAMKIAIKSLSNTPDHVLVDGYPIPDFSLPQTALIKGDDRSISIGAASIIAKVIRDRIMVNFSIKFPQYGFEKNKGYGTRFHLEAIERYGPCPIHRKTFRGVKEYL